MGISFVFETKQSERKKSSIKRGLTLNIRRTVRDINGDYLLTSTQLSENTSTIELKGNEVKIEIRSFVVIVVEGRVRDASDTMSESVVNPMDL